ncbi:MULTISPECIES: DUF6153 family protein [Streptomyces]|uniref:Uncharacterized protein n=1 Tax=Streptomyces venezuelae (strain ATCC 10712 / CBS 650.69 / DSM 40230 / JCM 4526 / NBRC 13096 / PD 04745) TaxID=953739 RepID=F2RJ49_STRVP|nr:DUF6153 family protein [Streptomyces venezuelae]APE25543.1 hypothetical protein vnz_33955 [Streptomyces venezuelae]CCA60175.1 hypothetical protein SVEN_6889 [Streptomyces venezuelae ATCC 10712]
MRTHPAERRRRAEGALARLLLVVVLALGVFLMHAVGHPEGSGGDTGTSPASAHAAASHHEAAPEGGAGSDARHDPGPGMDMTTLCVAVLSGWLLTCLVRAALGRRPDWLTLLLTRLTPALGPHAPPPRPPDLTQLSVLRI